MISSDGNGSFIIKRNLAISIMIITVISAIYSVAAFASNRSNDINYLKEEVKEIAIIEQKVKDCETKTLLIDDRLARIQQDIKEIKGDVKSLVNKK